MTLLLIVALALHVLAGVFWAGSTFTMARLGGLAGERLVAPQAGAAILVVLSGGYLWSTLHRGVFALPEQVLAGGVTAALIAMAVQMAMGFGALGELRRQKVDVDAARRRIAVAQRIAALLLAVTVICMGVARYV